MDDVDLLLDTTVLIDIFKGDVTAVNWARQNQALRIGIPVVVWMEIVHGARDGREQDRLYKGLNAYRVVYLDEKDQEQAREWLRAYCLSHDIGPFDCLIAATAVRIGKPLYTLDNDFSIIPSLQAIRPY